MTQFVFIASGHIIWKSILCNESHRTQICFCTVQHIALWRIAQKKVWHMSHCMNEALCPLEIDVLTKVSNLLCFILSFHTYILFFVFILNAGYVFMGGCIWLSWKGALLRGGEKHIWSNLFSHYGPLVPRTHRETKSHQKPQIKF